MYAFCLEYQKRTYSNVTECFGFFFFKKKHRQNPDIFYVNMYKISKVKKRKGNLIKISSDIMVINVIFHLES